MRGVWLRYGRDWTLVRRYNDDVVWMVLAALRAHEADGDARCLAAARTNFDRVWRRAWSQDLGGGLWWTTACGEKNACVNAPAVIAACRLAAALGEPRYVETAQCLYEWLRTRLFDEWSGRVNDHVKRSPDGGIEIDKRAYTYNQGAFAGAADLLHRLTGEQAYRADALRALRFTRFELAPDGILRSEGYGGDGGGFKGILARYAVPFARRHRLEELEDWLWLNAAAAWSRRDGCGLIDQDWAAATATRRRGPYAWDASSAVVLLQLLTAATPPTRPTPG
jgi:predicted alpha-1,6-mannanase (GH76 family)